MGKSARRWFFRVAALVLFIDLCPGVVPAKPVQTGGKYRVSIQSHVRAKMRDGVSLVADIYRPVSSEKFPVLVKRTPYNRAGEAVEANELASNGYLVVVQDTRGRYESEGVFYPFRDESRDGYDTVEWAAQLDQSNGKVGMFGGSYVGATQMLAAMAAPPHLLAIFPFVTSSDYYDGWTYQNGVLMQWFTSSWTSILAVDTLRRNAESTMVPRDWVGHLPVEKYQILKLSTSQSLAPYFSDWIEHEQNDSYWKQWRVSDHYAEMKIRGLHAAGWHDLFLKGSIKNYTGLRAEAPTAELRSGQRLIIGPWAHAPTSPEGKVGDVVFGKSAVLDEPASALKWFDYTLKGVNNEYASGAPVRLFIMGENVWRDEQEFPLARTRYTKYYLHSNGFASGPKSEGQLSVAPPADEPSDRFTYDPNNPVPTIGGRLCCGTSLAPGPFDQKANELRPDVLTFSTPALDRDLEVTGFISVELYASTSAVDTDFTALLVDVDERGYARFLTDGIVRARYAETTNSAKLIPPGKVYKYTIDLWATGNVFKAGHRVRLYISSSNFPRFNRNPNTGEVVLGSSKTAIAQQTIYHDRDRSSSLTLPVIPRN
jgi:putative CocE/NonD family hydrolase